MAASKAIEEAAAFSYDMKSKLINQKPKTYAVVFQTGEEVATLLRQFAQEHELQGSHFSAIGALSDVKLGYFNFARKGYDGITLNEQVEVLSLLGNIAIEKCEPKIHAHIVVGKADGTAHGGHLIEAHVRPTLEVIIEESPRHLRRKLNPEVGLALIDLDTGQKARPSGVADNRFQNRLKEHARIHASRPGTN